MALTKVRQPVADINNVSFGTSELTITSSGGPIDVNIGGVAALDITATTMTVGTALTLISALITGESIQLATGAGAEADILTDATDLTIQTTSAHPTIIGANSLTGLTVETDGQVTLAVVGDASAQLIDKNYVDTAVALLPALSAMVFAQTSPGSLLIPNSTGDDFVLNWGITASISNTQAAVTFDTAFPNAVFGGIACRQNATASLESSAHVNNVTTSGMNVVNSGGTSSPVFWIAIGY
jgi:hypothetical protein